MGNLETPLPPPQIKDGKMKRFGFCAASSTIVDSVQDCSSQLYRFYYVAGRHYTCSLAVMNKALTDLANVGVCYNLRSMNKVFMSSMYLKQDH